MFERTIPYNDLPLLPPKAELETKSILLKTISASRALAQLNGAIRNLPNPTLFLDTIHLQEAKASSAIENIINTNDDLYQVESRLAYNHASVCRFRHARFHVFIIFFQWSHGMP